MKYKKWYEYRKSYRNWEALDTSLENPHGLHEEGHLTTAYDLALIMNEATKKWRFC